MNLSSVNPYGAVPAALKESRLALRDIMADYLATKTQEANVNLMQKKAETDLAMVGANLERDRLTGERQDQRFQAEYDLRQAEARQRAHESDRTFKEGQRQFDINSKREQQRLGLAQADYARRNQAKPISEWAKDFGITPNQLSMYVSPEMHGQVITRDRADVLMASAMDFLNKNPAARVFHEQQRRKQVLDDLRTKLQDAKLPEQERNKLWSTYKDNFDSWKAINDVLLRADADPKAIAALAIKTWNSNEAIQAKYNDNLEAFTTDFGRAVKAINQNYGDMAKVQTPNDISYEQYLKNIKDHFVPTATVKDINQIVRALKEKESPEEKLQFAKGWNDYFLSLKNKAKP